jgi:hypothetical protein
MVAVVAWFGPWPQRVGMVVEVVVVEAEPTAEVKTDDNHPDSCFARLKFGPWLMMIHWVEELAVVVLNTKVQDRAVVAQDDDDDFATALWKVEVVE